MGALRLILALTVVAMHSGTTVFGVPSLPKGYAVDLFFIISGFYMAMVITEKYGAAGAFAFYRSRMLRLFPVYLIALVVAIVVSFGPIVQLISQLGTGAQLFFVGSNTLAAGLDVPLWSCFAATDGSCADGLSMIVNPPAWSISVELAFYLAAPFIVLSVRRTYLFALIGAVYLLAISFVDFPVSFVPLLGTPDAHALYYYNYGSSFLLFAVGALAYQLSRRIARPNYLAGILLVAVLIPATMSLDFWMPLMFAFAVPLLFSLTKDNKVDRVIGELSYPVYLLHYPVTIALRRLQLPEVGMLTLGTWVGLVCVVAGLAVYFLVERPINRYRAALDLTAPHPALARLRPVAPAMVAVYLAVPLAVVSTMLVVSAVGSAASR